MSTTSEPIKRNKAIEQFSKGHDFGSLLAWKIRQGIKNEVELERIKKYSDWHFKNYIKPFFDSMESHLFALLPDDHKSRKRAVAEHRKLERLFKDKKDLERSLSLIEELLDLNIRFEKGTLFNELMEEIDEDEFEKLEDVYEAPKEKFWPDMFWDEKK